MLLLIVLLAAGTTRAQEEDDRVAQLLALVNAARLSEGLPPYALSEELTASVQRHADDLVANDLSSYVGSDGSTAPQRIAEAGYAAWADGAMVGEIFWIGTGSAEAAFEWFMSDPPHRANILSTIYREIGAAVAQDGAGQFYHVLDFGARPNVIPIFINDGDETTDSPQVAVRLSNEGAFPQGQGTMFMGQAIEIRIGDAQTFEDESWQAWEELVPWSLADEPGEQAVYVQFRDAAGRTTTSVDTIALLPGAGTSVPPTRIPAPATEPAAGASAEPASSPTPSGVPGVEVSPAPLPTVTPRPTATPVPVAAITPTPFLTWTPLPPAAGPTPRTGSDALVGALCALQVLAVLMGLYLALRRSNHPAEGR